MNFSNNLFNSHTVKMRKPRLLNCKFAIGRQKFVIQLEKWFTQKEKNRQLNIFSAALRSGPHLFHITETGDCYCNPVTSVVSRSSPPWDTGSCYHHFLQRLLGSSTRFGLLSRDL